jgi:hypothetical protein
MSWEEVMKSSVICSVAVAAAFVVWVSPVALALDNLLSTVIGL